VGRIVVAIEQGSKRCFASALDWPGWCRSAKTDDEAVAALGAYADRFVPVARDAGYTLAGSWRFEVVERLKGSASTDFGVPGAIADHDGRRLTGAQAARQAALVAAAWRCLERVVRHAPASLRKGPRGGGRDRDAIVEHVVEAEVAYGSKLGLKRPTREELLAVLGEPSDGAPLREKGWPSRYAARRIAWHVLDHAWEIQDRS
jgi:hypothetical protein